MLTGISIVSYLLLCLQQSALDLPESQILGDFDYIKAASEELRRPKTEDIFLPHLEFGLSEPGLSLLIPTACLNRPKVEQTDESLLPALEFKASQELPGFFILPGEGSPEHLCRNFLDRLVLGNPAAQPWWGKYYDLTDEPREENVQDVQVLPVFPLAAGFEWKAECSSVHDDDVFKRDRSLSTEAAVRHTSAARKKKQKDSPVSAGRPRGQTISQTHELLYGLPAVKDMLWEIDEKLSGLVLKHAEKNALEGVPRFRTCDIRRMNYLNVELQLLLTEDGLRADFIAAVNVSLGRGSELALTKIGAVVLETVNNLKEDVFCPMLQKLDNYEDQSASQLKETLTRYLFLQSSPVVGEAKVKYLHSIYAKQRGTILKNFRQLVLLLNRKLNDHERRAREREMERGRRAAAAAAPTLWPTLANLSPPQDLMVRTLQHSQEVEARYRSILTQLQDVNTGRSSRVRTPRRNKVVPEAAAVDMWYWVSTHLSCPVPIFQSSEQE